MRKNVALKPESVQNENTFALKTHNCAHSYWMFNFTIGCSWLHWGFHCPGTRANITSALKIDCRVVIESNSLQPPAFIPGRFV